MKISMTREEYEQRYREYKEEREKAAQDPWRLHYHLMPESGWLNDPNGLCQFQGTYHIYYQYSPFDVEGKTKLWGHMTSRDLCTWKQEEPVLFPDSSYDDRGVYSGSAFLEEGILHYFYTGNVKLFDRDDYDYIHAGRLQNTMHVTSHDGYTFSEKKLVMSNPEYPKDMSCHVRDPKIYEHNGRYTMVLGARDLNDQGCVLVYESKDLENWSYWTRLEGDKPFGYMWECPDLFDLDEHQVLLTCPQGVQPQGYDYQNVHQCGYFLTQDDFLSGTRCEHFHQLDRGFDFYAPQTFMDEQGRRILIGWMGLPDIPYTNPTTQRGWQHALTIPRVLHVRNGRIVQEPIEELQNLRTEECTCSIQEVSSYHITNRVYEMIVNIKRLQSFTLCLRNTTTLSYDQEQQLLTLSMGEHGYGREKRSLSIQDVRSLRIFSDTSSLEIFINDGEEVFTTRVYEDEAQQELAFNDCKMEGNVVLYKLKSYQYQ